MSPANNGSLATYLFSLVARGNVFLLLFGVLGGVGFYGVTFLMPELYRSEAVLMMAKNDSGVDAGMVDGLSVLASVGGLQLGSSAKQDDVVLEIAKSKTFVMEFVKRRGVDVGNVDASLLKKYALFMKSFSIKKDKFSGLIFVSYVDKDKNLAMKTISMFIADLNDYVRGRDVDEAKRSNQYLEDELARNNQDAVKKMLYGLMEGNYRKIAFANSTQEYALKIIDAPYTPENIYSPQRLLFAIAGCVLMLVLGLCVLHFRKV